LYIGRSCFDVAVVIGCSLVPEPPAKIIPFILESIMILVLGASGYVGSAIKRELESRYIRHYCVSRSTIDYTDKKRFVELLRLIKPNYVINCAGVTGRPNVDACETDKIECLIGNAVLPIMLFESCRENGVIFGHVSSGCIYTGSKEACGGYTEEDEPNFSFKHNNCSWYSGCKALAEEMLPQSEMYVWRLRIPFDEHKSSRNFIYKVLNYSTLLNATNSMSHLGEFANVCIESILQRIPLGIYNVTNTGSITTKEIVEIIKNLRKDLCKDFKFFESESDFLQTVKTPRSNCVLNNSKLVSTGIAIRDIRDALIHSVMNYI